MPVPTSPPSTKDIDWAAWMRKIWGDKWLERDDAYEFSNGRKFKDPQGTSGPYTPTS